MRHEAVLIGAHASGRPSRSAMRQEAVRFASRYQDARSEAADRQSFWNDFFAIFGVDRTQVAAFELLARRASTGNRGWIDLIYPGQMAVEHKSAGSDLNAAMNQLLDYLPSLTTAEHPWLLVACDFQRFMWRDLRDGTTGQFPLTSLSDNLDLFSWIAGYTEQARLYENVADADLAATELLADIHDRLATHGFDGHPLREWLTRILFCLFADDTGVWDRAAFHAYVAAYTRPDGSDLGPALAYLFQILNTEPGSRPTNLDERLSQFTYINGDLFAETLAIPSCDADTRDALLKACVFDWSAISPAIFGSMFQNVMSKDERRSLGAHYTTEENILRTLNPLFLDELRSDLDKAHTKPAIEAFLLRLTKLTFFDPACGCGNFLVIAYREVRALETAAIRKLRAKQGRADQLTVDVSLLFRITVDQFYGIEIAEFPARIARTALYLIDHLCNRSASVEFGEHFVRFPIPASPHIVVGNALTVAWESVLPAARAVFVFGNPPFIGRGLLQAPQRRELEAIWGAALNSNVDYVSGWFARCVDYLRESPDARWAFVATSSICQGEAVPAVWPTVLSGGWRVRFAHRSLRWTSEAKGAAVVHVSIVGFDRCDTPRARLWVHDAGSPPLDLTVANINPYLADGPNCVVSPRESPLAPDLREVRFGNMARDGGHLLVEPADHPEVAADSVASRYLRPFIGARELMHTEARWCLWLVDMEPGDAIHSPILRRRLELVRAFRSSSKAASTAAMAATPHLFGQRSQPTVNYLAIPRHVSAARRFFPVGYFGPEVICGDANFVAVDPDGLLFGVLSSSMFAIWLKTVGGRIKSDLRFSKTLVYNNFPLQPLTHRDREALVGASQEVLAARAEFPSASLAELYDPLAMPEKLVNSHRRLDSVVDKLFGASRRLADDAARQRVLFDAFIRLTSSPSLSIDTSSG